MGTLRAEALVLGLSDYGEGHRLARIFTRDEGLIRAFAPAARKSRKRYGGVLEAMAHLDVVLTRRPGRDLPALVEARALGLRLQLRSVLERILLGTYFVEIVGMVLREGQPQPKLFDLLLAALDALDQAEPDPAILSPWGRVAMELSVLMANGSAPELRRCVICERVSEGARSRFSPREGGLCCGRCQPRWWPGDRVLARRTLSALGALVDAGLGPRILDHAAQLPREDLEAATEASLALGDTFDQLIGRAPRSRGILDQSSSGRAASPAEQGKAQTDEDPGEPRSGWP